MTDTKRLREIVNESGLKYQFIAEKMGLSRFGLMKKIENETEFKTSEVEKLCEILHIDSVEERMEIFFAKTVENKATQEVMQ